MVMFWILIYLWLIAQKMAEVNVSLNNLEPMECSLNDEPQNEPSLNDDQEAEEDEDGNPFEAKKRKKTSKVWQEFKVVTLKDGVTKAECIHCKDKLKIAKSGATTTFLRHLKICTRRTINLSGQQQLVVNSAIAETEAVSSVQNFKYDQTKIREIVSHMIMVHELPFVFVEYDLFNLLMRTATPNYQRISRATVRKDCFTSYELEKKKKLLTLLKNASRISVTTDL